MTNSDQLVIQEYIRGDDDFSALGYTASFWDAEVDEISDIDALINQLDKMPYVSDKGQYYQLWHQDLLLINNDSLIPVEVHYIYPSLWDKISQGADILVYNPPPVFFSKPISGMKLEAEDRIIASNDTVIYSTFDMHDGVGNWINNVHFSNEDKDLMQIWMKMENFDLIPVRDLSEGYDPSEYQVLVEIPLEFRNGWILISSVFIDKQSISGIRSYAEIEDIIIELQNTIVDFWLYNHGKSIHGFASDLNDWYRLESEGTEIEGLGLILIFSFLVLEVIILLVMNGHIKSYETNFRLFYQRGYSMRKNKRRLWKKLVFKPLLVVFLLQLATLLVFFLIRPVHTNVRDYALLLFVFWFMIQFLASSVLALRNFRYFVIRSYGHTIATPFRISARSKIRLNTSLLLVLTFIAAFMFQDFSDLPFLMWLLPIALFVLIADRISSVFLKKLEKTDGIDTLLFYKQIVKHQGLLSLIFTLMLIYQQVLLPIAPAILTYDNTDTRFNYSIKVENPGNLIHTFGYNISEIQGVESHFSMICMDTDLEINDHRVIRSVVIIDYAKINTHYHQDKDIQFLLEHQDKVMVSDDLDYALGSGTFNLGNTQLEIPEHAEIIPRNMDPVYPNYGAIILGMNVLASLGIDLAEALEQAPSHSSYFRIPLMVDPQVKVDMLISRIAEETRIPEHRIHAAPEIVKPHIDTINLVLPVLVSIMVTILDIFALVILFGDKEFIQILDLLRTKYGAVIETNAIASKTNTFVLVAYLGSYLFAFLGTAILLLLPYPMYLPLLFISSAFLPISIMILHLVVWKLMTTRSN